jgi:hypothetical protein
MICPAESPAVRNATVLGNCSSRPAARASVLTPMKVPPNRIAPSRAAAPLAVHARAIPAVCREQGGGQQYRV